VGVDIEIDRAFWINRKCSSSSSSCSSSPTSAVEFDFSGTLHWRGGGEWRRWLLAEAKAAARLCRRRSRFGSIVGEERAVKRREATDCFRPTFMLFFRRPIAPLVADDLCCNNFIYPQSGPINQLLIPSMNPFLYLLRVATVMPPCCDEAIAISAVWFGNSLFSIWSTSSWLWPEIPVRLYKNIDDQHSFYCPRKIYHFSPLFFPGHYSIFCHCLLINLITKDKNNKIYKEGRKLSG